MTGIFGYYKKFIDKDQILEPINKLGYQNQDVESNQNILLGSLNIKSYKQKKFSQKTEDELLIVYCGEIYNEEFPDIPTTILNFYRMGKLNELEKLNGTFAAALYDIKKEKILLINDRYGTIKLFYHYEKNFFCFSPKIQPLLQWGVKRTLSKEAIYDFFLFRYILGKKTLFKEINQLPPGSILEISPDQQQLRQYWTYHFNVKYDARPDEELVNELKTHWQKAIQRRIKKDEQIIIPLSGGLDSRAILAETLRQKVKDKIITYTFGEQNSYDYQIGQKIAQIAGVKNITIRPIKKDFEKQYINSIQNIEGMIDATPYFPLNITEQFDQLGDTISSGHMGGEIMGPMIFSKILKKKFNSQQIQKIIYTHHKLHNPQDIKPLFNKEFLKNDNLTTSFDNSIKKIENISQNQLPNFCAAWLYNQEVDKYTHFCNVRYRNFFMYSFPFLDNNLIDFMLNVPPRLRKNKKLYKQMLLLTYPELFQLPTKNNLGYKLTTNNLLIFLKRSWFFLQGKLNSISKYFFKKNIFFYKTQNYLNYDDLLRTNKEYQDFIRKKINKIKTRDFFNSHYIEKLWKSHLTGKENNAVLLCLLVTFELFLEKYIDSSS